MALPAPHAVAFPAPPHLDSLLGPEGPMAEPGFHAVAFPAPHVVSLAGAAGHFEEEGAQLVALSVFQLVSAAAFQGPVGQAAACRHMSSTSHRARGEQ